MIQTQVQIERGELKNCKHVLQIFRSHPRLYLRGLIRRDIRIQNFTSVCLKTKKITKKTHSFLLTYGTQLISFKLQIYTPLDFTHYDG